MNHLWDRDDSSPCVVYGSEWADTAAEIAAEQRVAVMIMDSLRSCNERVVAFATHSIQLLLVLLPVEHCALRCQKFGIHRFNSGTIVPYITGQKKNN